MRFHRHTFNCVAFLCVKGTNPRTFLLGHLKAIFYLTSVT